MQEDTDIRMLVSFSTVTSFGTSHLFSSVQTHTLSRFLCTGELASNNVQLHDVGSCGRTTTAGG